MKKVKWFTYWIGLMALCLLLGFLLPGFADAFGTQEAASPFNSVEVEWGIKPLTIRLTGADHFLDFRYLIVNPEKVKQISHRMQKMSLADQKTGETFQVTFTKNGSVEDASTNPKVGSRSFILFTNSNKSIKRGQKVTVIMDGCRVEDLTVE